VDLQAADTVSLHIARMAFSVVANSPAGVNVEL
jgi:hypothetical protein